MWACVASWHCC